ncbi:MerR family transcriptional regulator [Paenibacillus sp. M1]|uniref:MerR family transcriptional regulator n=1 Tax=Paenibacillus haidiansis TaxID=1574488 RepID=A0ABU7VXN7_9BACL
MRIGEFAKKNNITQDTIRHYIDLGLLVVEKQGSWYKFSQKDSSDLEKIFILKQLDFSLGEILKVLSFHRLEGDKSAEYRDFYLSFLERKKEQIMKEQQKFREIDFQLKDKISEMKLDEAKQGTRLGFPLSSIALLRCPDCKNMMDIRSGTLKTNMILDAEIQCACGYSAAIEDGIYIDKQMAATKKRLPTKKQFLEATSPRYINFMYNGSTILIDYIQSYASGPKYILELDHCIGRFLMQYIDELPDNCTYILVCQDRARIAAVKNDLLQHRHSRFIFLCCEEDRLPIADGAMDIVVDHGLSRSYAKTTGRFLPERLGPLLKEEGLIAASFPHAGTEFNGSGNIDIGTGEYFHKDTILEKLKKLHFSELDIADIGPIIESSPYIEMKDHEQYLTLYVGKKTSG